MAFEEVKIGEDLEEEEGTFALPVPTAKSLNIIQESLFEEVKAGFADDPDPLFNQIEWGDSQGSQAGGGGSASVTAGNFEELAPPERIAPPPSEKEDSIRQRAIYGLERGAAGMVQSFAKQQLAGDVNLLNQIEADPEKAQFYANQIGGAYGLEALGEGETTYDYEEFVGAVRNKIQERITSQSIRKDAISGIPVGESLTAVAEAETFGEAFSAFLEDPLGVTVEGLAESFPMMLPGLIAAPFIGIAAAPLFGATSYAVERGGMMEEGMDAIAEAKGIDLSTVEGQQELISTKEFASFMALASHGAGVVGAADTVAGLLPGVKLIAGKPIREFLAQLASQSILGMVGEAGKQVITEGHVAHPGAVFLEGILEVPGGALEIGAIRADVLALREEKAGGTDDDGGGGTRSLQDPDPELGDPADATAAGDVLDIESETASYEVPDEGMSEAEKVALEDALDNQTETSAAPEAETAATPTEPTEAPVTPVAAEPVVEDEVITGDDLVTEPVVEEEVVGEEVVEQETTMIDAKELKKKINSQLKGTAAEQKPIRGAWKGLVDAIRQRFPDVELPVVRGRLTGLSLGKFFEALHEQVDLESLPDLKAYLNEVTTGTPAETIKSLERVTSGVVAEIESTTVGKGGPVLTQLRAVVNKFNESLKERGKKKDGSKARHLIAHANEIGELAVGVKEAVEEAAQLGALEGLSGDFNKTISAAITVFNAAQAPREVRTSAGGKQLKVDRTSRAHLNKLGTELLRIADDIAVLIADREAGKTEADYSALEGHLAELDALVENTTAKAKAIKKTSAARKSDTEAKATPKESVTEAVSEPKKAEVTVTNENLVATETGLYAVEKPEVKVTVKKNKGKPRSSSDAAIEADNKAVEEAASDVVARTGDSKTVSLSKAAKAEAANDTSQTTTKSKFVLKEVAGKLYRIGKYQDRPGSDPVFTLPGVNDKVYKSMGGALSSLRARLKKGEVIESTTVEESIPDAEYADTKKDKKGAKATETSQEKTAAKKEGTKKVKGAKPDEVFDPEVEHHIGGREGVNLVTKAGLEGGLVENLEAAGVSKAAADKLRAIYNSVSKKQAKQIQKAAEEYLKHGIQLRFASDIAAIVEAVPGADVILAFREFYDVLSNESVDIGSLREDLINQRAEEANESLEDAEFFLEQNGEIESIAPDEETGGATGISEVDYARGNRDENPSLDHTNQNRGDRMRLSRAMDRMRTFFDGLVQGSTDYSFIKGLFRLGKETVIEKVTMQDVLAQLLEHLPKNHSYRILAERLNKLKINIPITFHNNLRDIDPDNDAIGIHKSGWITSKDGGLTIDMNEARIKLFYDPSRLSDSSFLHTLLHEMLHAASVYAYYTDSAYQLQINELYRQALDAFSKRHPNVEVFSAELIAKIQEGGWTNALADEIEARIIELEGDNKAFYGLVNPKEMISEIFTNSRFQKFLGDTEVEATHLLPFGTIQSEAKTKAYGGFVINTASILGRFMLALKKHLGYSARNPLLNEILFAVDRFGLSTQANIDSIERDVGRGIKKPFQVGVEGPASTSAMSKPKSASSPNNQRLDSFRAIKQGVAAAIKSMSGRVKDASGRVLLAVRNRDVIERKTRKFMDSVADKFGLEANPMTIFHHAKNSVSSRAKVYEDKAFKLIKEYTALKIPSARELKIQMRNVTMADVWPNRSLKHPDNAHLWRTNKKGVRKLTKAAQDRAVPARVAFDKFQKEHPQAAKLLVKMALLTKEIHRAKIKASLFALGEGFRLDTKVIKAIENAKEAKDIDAIFDPDIVESLTKKLEDKKLTKEEKKKLTAELSTAETQEEIAKTAKVILEESNIKGMYFPLRRYGEWFVSTSKDTKKKDSFLSAHATRDEAKAFAAKMIASGTAVHVSRKIQSAATIGASKIVVSNLLKKIPDKATRDKVKTALSQVLASNAVYESQLKRHNIDGAAADDMARAFEEYVHISKFTIGDLLTAHKISQAMMDMNTMKANDEGELTAEEVGKVADIVDEIEQRNKEDMAERSPSIIQRVLGVVGFANYLGAPSYWALNATQTLTITLPKLYSMYGIKETLKAMAIADKTVFSAVFAALNSNDKSYEGFKAQLPPAARKLVEQLEADGIIQATIAHQFGDMLSPTALNKLRDHAMGAPVAKTISMTMEVMVKVPEAIEHFNRISTALATYSLSKGDLQITVDVVNMTQFNYETNNRGRVLKSLPGGGGRALIGPVMMFKTYGLGVAELFYGAILDVAMKKGGRVEAGKLAASLILSHTIFGGVAGGLMVAPIVLIQTVVNALFKEVDDEWDLQHYLTELARELGGDTAAIAVEKGLPAAFLGVDWSRSVNLGNLVLMGNDRADYSTTEGFYAAVAKTLAGPIGDYTANSVVQGLRLINGDTRGGGWEFLEAAVPLKAYRGVSQAIRYNLEGLETSGKLVMLTPEEFTSTIQTAMGFQATQKTVIQSEYYDDLKRDQRRSHRKSELTKKMLAKALKGENFDDLLEQVLSYNLSVPESKYRFSSGDISALRRTRMKNQREFYRNYGYTN